MGLCDWLMPLSVVISVNNSYTSGRSGRQQWKVTAPKQRNFKYGEKKQSPFHFSRLTTKDHRCRHGE